MEGMQKIIMLYICVWRGPWPTLYDFFNWLHHFCNFFFTFNDNKVRINENFGRKILAEIYL